MQWVEDYQLFLFDFDGLLVNTEEIHYEAYKRMCRGRGFELPWNFAHYCTIAHYSAHGLRENIYKDLPDIESQEPRWEVLYAEKKQAYLDLLDEGAVALMPGVEFLLSLLQKNNVKRCVVTHSAMEQVSIIRQQHPILETIPTWLTREDYHLPKPDPECYLKAIKKLASPDEKVIGFEDSPRGLTALFGTMAQPVLVSSMLYPEIPQFLQKGAWHFPSFEAIK